MCVTVLAVRLIRLIGAILDAFWGRGYLLFTAKSGDEGQDGILSRANRDAGCFVEEGDDTVYQVGGVDAEAAAQESDKYDYEHGDAERETEQAMIERA